MYLILSITQLNRTASPSKVFLDKSVNYLDFDLLLKHSFSTSAATVETSSIKIFSIISKIKTHLLRGVSSNSHAMTAALSAETDYFIFILSCQQLHHSSIFGVR